MLTLDKFEVYGCNSVQKPPRNSEETFTDFIFLFFAESREIPGHSASVARPGFTFIEITGEHVRETVGIAGSGTGYKSSDKELREKLRGRSKTTVCLESRCSVGAMRA